MNFRSLSLTRLMLAVVASLLMVGPSLAAAADYDVNEVITNTSQRLRDTESMAFSMEIDGSTYIDDADSIQLVSAEGVMARPNAVDVEFTAEFLGAKQISIRMITIGEESWITDLVTGSWVTSPPEFGFNPAVLYDDQNGLGPVMGKITDPKISGEEEIDGVNCIKLEGVVTQDVIKKLTSGTLRGDEVGLTVWIDPETWNVHQIRLAEPTDQDIDDPATWTMHLSKHDEEVTIEKPE